MRPGKVKSIFLKEILDTMRDRRTLLIMIVVPVLLYPALFLFLNEIATSQLAKLEEKTVRVAFFNEPPGKLGERLRKEEGIQVVDVDDPAKQVKEGSIHFAIEFPPEAEEILRDYGTVPVTLHFDESNEDATTNLSRLRTVIDAYSDEILAERLKERGLSGQYVKPLEIQEVNVASREKMGGFLIGRVLPMLMVLMVLMGAMYPAIDMTAGEKERGTLETILTSPATRAEIVVGKFLTVALIALLTGLLNLGSMTATFAFGILRQAAAQIQIAIPYSSLIIIVLCLVPLSVFFAGMMMAIASFARSFKEAQNAITPFYLIAMLPAMVSIIPGIQLEGFWLTMPVANVTLLFKELMLGEYDVNHILIVLFVTGFLASAAVFLAIRLFGREEILFGDASSFGITLRRANLAPKQTPTAAESFLFTLILMMLLLYAAIPLQARDLVSGLLIKELALFLGVPVGFALYLKLNVRETFRLHVPSVYSVLSTLVMAAGLSLCVGTILYLQNRLFPIPRELFDVMDKVMKQAHEFPLGGAFMLIAFLPAVCEETTFRGMILSGMLKRFRPATAILITAFLFGMFHLSLHRFPGVFLIGMAATFVVWRSGSIFTGMLLHMWNNGLATFLVTHPQYDFLGLMEMRYSIPQFAAGMCLVALSVYLFQRGMKAGTRDR